MGRKFNKYQKCSRKFILENMNDEGDINEQKKENQ